MKKIILLFIFLTVLGRISAQSFNVRFNHFLNEPLKVFDSSDTLKILAVLVEFKEDNDPNTFGTGKFGSIYTQDYGDTILDPLPHDAKYFENHLEFAKNYFKKVSNGKLNISYTVLPNVITVSQIMRNYSPPPTNPNDLSNLGKFAKEVWHLAGSIYSDIDFSKYDLFTIFHAGVGNAYYPNGRLGIERDLPSIYLGEKTLKSIFGTDFNGFPAKNFLIKNTIILPTTESKEIESFGQKVLYQMSINGLIVSNIASYLGLPDLFNTETGVTAIDRFGLMDGNAIFAFNGTFPPEPSPWEKIYLGWAEPIVINQDVNHVNVTARLAAALNDTVIIKVPINSSEYYLIENRQRDVRKDGAVITYKIGNNSFRFSVDKDKNRFNFSNADTLRGVVTDVDEFDWAVPGNGIVIWHIDENIINEKIDENKINVDIEQKGVDVEEADGIQDIGEHFSSVLGDFYGIGSQEDFWYSNNKAKLYKNKFGPDTKPNTKSNSGANSLITIENFSESSPKMSFDIKFGEDLIRVLSSQKFNFVSPKSISVPYGSTTSTYILDGSKLLILDESNSIVKSYENFSDSTIASLKYNGTEYVFGSLGNRFNYYLKTPSKETLEKFDLSAKITTPIVISFDNGNLYACAGTENGLLLKVNLTFLENNLEQKYTVAKIADDELIQICKPFSSNNNYYSVITKSSYYDSENFKIALPYKPIKAALLFDEINSTYITIVLAEQNNFYIIQKGKIISEFKIDSKNKINSFSIMNNSPEEEELILVNDGNKIEAYNFRGVLLDNFPILESDGSEFITTPLTTDLNGDLIADIITIANNGKLYAFDGKSGKIIEPFPISIGDAVDVTPIIYRYTPLESMSPIALQGIILIDNKNYLHRWIIGTTNDSNSWNSELANSMNNSAISFVKSENPEKRFFPLEKVYNWPNPVYNGETFIRYYVSENSEVKIKIFDLAGDFVSELSDNAVGGFDNETKWNVSNVQSGVYFASIEVKSITGKTAKKVIKIAVIK